MPGILALACALAALSGFLLTVSFGGWMRGRERHRHLREAMRPASAEASVSGSGGMSGGAVVGIVCRESARVSDGWLPEIANLPIWGLGCRHPELMLSRAGLSELANPRGMRIARIRLTASGLFIGLIIGAVFSSELAVALALVGCVLGFLAVPSALRSQAAARNADMERHLSEMVEVVVLGLESGLSFERSFALYPRYFDTGLGQSMSRVASRWEMGLVTREEALRALEAEYDSPLLSRVVRSMVRSLRFGTSISNALAASAVEAREVHRTRMEERVAKVAVKMMLPVGALILPAMLLLVLGPVMLELVQGF